MYFRHKVIMINIAFLSMALGILGFIIIHRNFNQSLNIQTSYAVEENNLIQSSVEYQILDLLNNDAVNWKNRLKEIGIKTNNGILLQFSSFYLVYDNQVVYRSDSDEETSTSPYPETLLTSIKLGEKNYMMRQETDGYYIYVISKSVINGTDFNIITKRNADDTFQLLQSQNRYFLLLMLLVLCICSVFLHFISQYLTKPLEQLNQITDYFTNGNYTVRASTSSNDEFGMLAQKFNQMAAAVSKHIEELNGMVKQREQFVADFTHEIKTPMTTIIGYADTLRNGNLDREKSLLAYEYIYHEGKRLETMSMKLFDLIYLKDNEIQKSEIYSTELAEEVRNSMQPILDQKNIVLITDVFPAVIWGEPELLKSVFINLIDNAKKASCSHSEIYLRGFVQEPSYVFEVEDSGCGMDEKTLLHIYDEFYMADKSRSRAEGGAGLGMSIVSLITGKHGVLLDIKSSPEAGTTVSIQFPDFYPILEEKEEEQ